VILCADNNLNQTFGRIGTIKIVMEKTDILYIWREFLQDVATPVALWQLSVIVIACGSAWLINGLLRRYVMKNAPENWKLAIGGINRILFPITSLIFILFGKLILSHWQHTSLLHLASTLFVAMAVVRLLVYAIRYIVSPGGFLKTLESTFASVIWLVFALHLTGLLPEISQALQAFEFNLGKTKLNLLIVLQAILTIFITLFLALWCSRAIENKLMNNAQININMRVVLSKVLRIVFIFFAVLIGLSAVGLDITVLSVFGGALGVGLGFGLQRIASNYVSGFILLLDKSMKIGDIITVDEKHYGEIAELRTRYLVLKKLDGTEVIVPNEMLVINSVINHSYADRNTRVLLPIQVSYESDLDFVLKLLTQIASSNTRVLKTPEPAANIINFAESGVELSLTVWIDDPENGQLALKSALYLEIWRQFKVHNIYIPYPQREIKILATERIE